ncbi:hypothetical protein SARC_01549 [Sphaeroforma arctica JP610]|uniref:Uncharacterized protein n=1 Tax=Sphaeroforma arctica JP610 TaxID=667725 RepID=A0A0L0GB90_9EUKA|nr:hypothetical protein SARC_01549 [Sphaeroforma arctica JP610]KNC86287.1 hypothetical protein SARC_01549 [Sphaeroforma arctica JP610]|eukprot:XP_014160189.1 hypothetical protein SARC_01549 [Sphaeroforma arctica JP610]
MDAEHSTHSPRGSPATTEDTHKSDKCTSYESLTIESTPADSQHVAVAEAVVCGSLSDTATIDSHMGRRQIAVGVNISSVDVNVSAGASSVLAVVRLDECAPPTAVVSVRDGHANTSAQAVSGVLESSNTPPTSLAQQQESWRCGGPSAENRASIKGSPLTNHPVSARHLTEQYIQSHELDTKSDETVAGQPHDTSHYQITTNTPADTVSPQTCASVANVWTQRQTRGHLLVMRRRYAQRRSQDIVVYDELGRPILTHAVGGDSGARVLVCEPIRVPPQATMADDCVSIDRPAAEAGSSTGNRDVYRDGVEACTTSVDDRSVGVTATSPGTMKGTSGFAADRETPLYEGATDRGAPSYEGAMHGDGMEGGTVHVDGPINGPESGPKSSTRMREQSAVDYTQGDQSITATGTSMGEQSAADYTQGDQSIKATGTSMGEQSTVDLEMQMDALEHAVACREELLSGEEELAVEALETMATVCGSPIKEGTAKGSAESPAVSTSDFGLTLDTDDDEPELLATEVDGGDIADTAALREMKTGIGSLSATPLADSCPKSPLQTAIGEVASAAAAYECARESVRSSISPHQIAVTPPDTTQTETGHTNTTTLASARGCDGSRIADEKDDGAFGRPSPGCVRNSSQWSQESVAGSHACGCADCAVCSDGRERKALRSTPTLHPVFRIASKLLSDVQDTRDSTEHHTVSSECGVERVSDGTRDTTTPIYTTEPNTAVKELGRNVVDPHLASSSPDAKHQEPHDSETQDASSKCASVGDGRSPMEGAVEHTEFDTPTDDPKGITCPSEVSAATSGAMSAQETAVKSQSVVDEGDIPTVLAGADASGERGVQLEGDPISQRHNRDDTNTAQHAPKIERLPDASTLAERGGRSEGSHRDGRRYSHARIDPTKGSVDAYGYGGVTVHARSDSGVDTGQPNDGYTACSNRKRMRSEADAQPPPGRTTRNKSDDKALERGEGLSPTGGGMGLSTQGVDKDARVGVQDASLADLGLVAVPKCTGEHPSHARAATPSQLVTTERSPVSSELATVDERKEERSASCDIVSQSTGDTLCVALDGPHTLTSEKEVRLDGLKGDTPQHTVTAGQGQDTNGDTLCRDGTDLVQDVTTRTEDVFRTEGGAHNVFDLCSLTQPGKVYGEITSDTTLEVEGKEHDTSLTSMPRADCGHTHQLSEISEPLTTSASKTKTKPKSTPKPRPKSKQKSKPKPKARTNPKPTFTSEFNTKFKFDEFLWQSGPYTRSQAASEHDRSPAVKATHTPEVQSTSQQGRGRGDSTYGKKVGRQKKGHTGPTNDSTPQQPTETLNTQPQKASTTNTAHRRKRAYASDMDADGKETQPQKRTKQAKQAKQATAKGKAAADPEQTYGHATVPKMVVSICEQTSVETDGVVREMGTQPADTSSAATYTSTHTLAETGKRGKSGKANPRVSAKARTGQAVKIKTATPAHAKVSSHRPEGDRRVSKRVKCHTLDTQGLSQALTTDTVHGTQPCRLKMIGPRAQSLEEAQEDAVMSGSGDTAGAKATEREVGLSVCETEEHKGVRQSVDSTDPVRVSGAEVQRVTGHTIGEDEEEILCGEIIGLGRVSTTGIHADEATGAHAGATRVHPQQTAHTPPLTQPEHATAALSTQNTPQTTQTPETPYVSQTPQTQFTEHARQRGHTPQVEQEQLSDTPHVPQTAQALHAVQTAHTP